MIFALIGVLAAATFGPSDLGRWPAGFPAQDIVFRPRERAVSNWRFEAALHVEASYGTAAAILLGRDPAQVTRCVRLNNYWCIKRAGWAGEIAADADGHVAFASAAEGADVAALLLRRYYVDYGRHSALAIISHWAPASCGFLAPRPAPRDLGLPAADHLTTRGLGHTLRARFLASRGRRPGRGLVARPHRSVVPDRLIGHATPAPNIVADLGERPLTLLSEPLKVLPEVALLSVPTARPLTGEPSCVGDDARIRAYAAKVSADVSLSLTDDLKLFGGDGRPTPNLGRVMHAMSAVEIGPLGAAKPLVELAVAHVAEVIAHPPVPPAAAGKPVATR